MISNQFSTFRPPVRMYISVHNVCPKVSLLHTYIFLPHLSPKLLVFLKYSHDKIWHPISNRRLEFKLTHLILWMQLGTFPSPPTMNFNDPLNINEVRQYSYCLLMDECLCYHSWPLDLWNDPLLGSVIPDLVWKSWKPGNFAVILIDRQLGIYLTHKCLNWS